MASQWRYVDRMKLDDGDVEVNVTENLTPQFRGKRFINFESDWGGALVQLTVEEWQHVLPFVTAALAKVIDTGDG